MRYFLLLVISCVASVAVGALAMLAASDKITYATNANMPTDTRIELEKMGAVRIRRAE